MAKYTIKLGDILQNLIVSKDKKASEIAYLDGFELNKNPYYVIENSRTLFFDFAYPLYDSTHKEELETKILAHYYNYEIGVEMPTYFKFLMRRTLNEIMPKYNEMYRVCAKKFNPFNNTDIKTTIDGSGNNKANNKGNSSLSTKADDTYSNKYSDKLRESDTPQGKISDVDNDSYMSKYQNNNGTEENTKSNKTTGENWNNNESSAEYENEQETKVLGNDGKKSKSELIVEFKKAIQNIDLDIIYELESCFMQVLD